MLAVFTNDRGDVLVGERISPPGSWQFPQGGIDAGESAEVALHREMLEELGCKGVEILKRLPEPIRYHFPANTSAPVAKHFRGQDQVWFLVRLAKGAVFDLEHARDKELSALEWVTADEALRRVVPFKREAYVIGLGALGLLTKGS